MGKKLKLYYGQVLIANGKGTQQGLIIADCRKRAEKLMEDQSTDPLAKATVLKVKNSEAFIQLAKGIIPKLVTHKKKHK